MPLRFNERILDEILDRIVDRGNRTLDAIQSTAHDIAPERTGDLKAGIQVLKYFTRGSLYGAVGVVGVFYAPFVHFGTKHMAARPFLLQAFDLRANIFVGGSSLGIAISPTRYSFPQDRKHYTYLRPGEAPPAELASSGINFLPVTPGGSRFDSVR